LINYLHLGKPLGTASAIMDRQPATGPDGAGRVRSPKDGGGRGQGGDVGQAATASAAMITMNRTVRPLLSIAALIASHMGSR
jgi:hypothetical protein